MRGGGGDGKGGRVNGEEKREERNEKGRGV